MPDFLELKPYIEIWALSSASERLQKRVDTDLAGQQEFYNAASPHLDAIIEYLNQFPVDEIPEKDKPLAYMTLALCEVDDAIHLWKAANLDYISDPVTWRTKNTFGDYQ
jgi:hypothetical protein